MANPTTPPNPNPTPDSNPTPKTTAQTTNTSPDPNAVDPTSTSNPTPKNLSVKAPASADGKEQGISQEIIDQLSRDINIMLSFAAKNGIIINTQINDLVQNSSIDDLIEAYNLLCKNVAPATPKSIEYTRRVNAEGKSKTIFNKIPLVRNLIILALFFLVAYILFGLSTHVSDSSLDKGVMNNHGIPLLYNLGYLASISGLGVLFHLLKTISNSVERSTLVPEESVNYMAQILLGVIAGLLMSEVISVYQTDPDQVNLFNKSLLALIGGFSSDAIFTILEALITRLKNIFIPANSVTPRQ
jgi:hypothetical protein